MTEKHLPGGDLFTSKELAQKLKVTPRTIQGWRERDTGPAYILVGGQIRYQANDVQQWLDQNRSDKK